MSSIFNNIMQDTINFVTKQIQDATDMIKMKLDEDLFNFEQFVATGDELYLKKEESKCSKKTRQKEELRSKKTVSNVLGTIGDVKIKTDTVTTIFSRCQGISF